MNNNIMKEIPEIKFKEKKALVILATQRSGSTMLCEDIQSLKVLGSPNEHFLGVLNKKGENTGNELVEYFTSNGNKYNSEFYSIKLMYDQLAQLGYWVSDRSKSLNEKSAEIYREKALGFFLEKFEDVTFIYLKRKSKFEQALSHYRAIKTNIFHIINGNKVKSNFQDSIKEECLLDDIDVNLFHKMYDRACNEDKVLQLLINKVGINYLSLIYEEIRDNYPNYLLEISDMAGIEINIDSLGKRKIKKIVSNDFVVEFKKNLIEKTNREYI